VDMYPLMGPYDTMLILDDSDPAFFTINGIWNFGYPSNAFNDEIKYSMPGNGDAKVGWRTDNIIKPGLYGIYVWKFEHLYSPTMATNAPYQIYHKNGQTRFITVDQSTPGNEWIYIGSYEFDNSHAQGVLLTNNADGVVSADAIKLVYLDSLNC